MFFFRASGEAILGTQRYFSKDALIPTSFRWWVLKLPSANTRGIAGYKIQNPAARGWLAAEALASKLAAEALATGWLPGQCSQPGGPKKG